MNTILRGHPLFEVGRYLTCVSHFWVVEDSEHWLSDP